MSVDQNAQPRRLIGLAEQRHLVEGVKFGFVAIVRARAHEQRMDDRDLRRREALAQAFELVFVHQEADGAAMHPVDRFVGVHEGVQGLQHQPVAAERDDDVGPFGGDVAVARDELPARLLSLGGWGLPRRRSARSFGVAGLMLRARFFGCRVAGATVAA